MKRTRDSTDGEKVYTEMGNIEDLVQRKRRGGSSSTMALDCTRSAMGNGKKGNGRRCDDIMIRVVKYISYERKPLNQ